MTAECIQTTLLHPKILNNTLLYLFHFLVKHSLISNGCCCCNQCVPKIDLFFLPITNRLQRTMILTLFVLITKYNLCFVLRFGCYFSTISHMHVYIYIVVLLITSIYTGFNCYASTSTFNLSIC